MKERLGKWNKHGVGHVFTSSRAQLRIVCELHYYRDPMKYLLHVHDGEVMHRPFGKYQPRTRFRLFFAPFFRRSFFYPLLLLMSVAKGLSVASPIYSIFRSFQGTRSLVFDFNYPSTAPSHIIFRAIRYTLSGDFRRNPRWNTDQSIVAPSHV
jgi:hypothetical protein